MGLKLKVQTKLIFLITSFVVLFFAMLLYETHIVSKRTDMQYDNIKNDREIIFDRLLDLKSSSIETFITDYSYWDDLVSFIRTGDKEWASINIDSTFSTFNSNFVWVYRLNCTPVYATNNIDAGNIDNIPLPGSEIQGLFKRNKFCHFFVKIPQGLLEIRGSTVHPSDDITRITPPKGYLFAGRLWKAEFVDDLSKLTNSSVTIVSADAEDVVLGKKERKKGFIAFHRNLRSWDDKIAAKLNIATNSVLVQEINKSSDWHITSFLFFGLTVVILLTIVLYIFVSRPLSQISKSLDSEKTATLLKLKDNHTEFGHIARMIISFFQQKQELKRAHDELEERVHARTLELREAYDKLQEETREHIQLEVEKEKLWARLVHSEKLAALGKLGSGIAHEISNPLTSIIGFAQGMLLEINEGHKFYGAVKYIETEAIRSKNFLQNILSFSRTGKIEKEKCNINELIKNTLPLVEAKAKIHSIILNKELDNTISETYVSCTKIQQVLVNLCNNAMDAMKEGGTLTISTVNGGEYIGLRVEDNGSGIPDEIISNIFEPFFTTKSESKGTGLGLSIVKEIINEHGGTVEVKSELDKGTIFVIKLPVVSFEND